MVTATSQSKQSNGIDIRSRIAERWSSINERELDHIGSHADRLIRVLQRRYGLSQQTAVRDVRAFLTRVCHEYRVASR